MPESPPESPGTLTRLEVMEQLALEGHDTHVEVADVKVDVLSFVGSAHPDVKEPGSIAQRDVAVGVDSVGGHSKMRSDDG